MSIRDLPDGQWDYASSIRRRAQTISDQGTAQTTWERMKRNMEIARQPLPTPNPEYVEAQRSAMANNGMAGSDPINRFIDAIGQQESGGNYRARNPSGAMGKYQIMPMALGGRGNGWDYEVLGRDVSPTEFMNSPQIQEAIARKKLSQYYKSYGPSGAAIAWYAGEGTAKKYARTGQASTRTQAGGYPSINSYAKSILKRLGLGS